MRKEGEEGIIITEKMDEPSEEIEVGPTSIDVTDEGISIGPTSIDVTDNSLRQSKHLQQNNRKNYKNRISKKSSHKRNPELAKTNRRGK